MYLSRIRVAPQGLDRNTLYRLLNGNAYGHHQLLWRLFPNADERPFLFRQELENEAPALTSNRGMPLFYVLSTLEPAPAPQLLSCETKAFQPKLAAGQELAFKLRANPVVARRQPDRKNSRRHDVLMDAKQAARATDCAKGDVQQAMDTAARDWLADDARSHNAGYRLTTEPQISGYRQHSYKRKSRNIRFSSVDYAGRLAITDPERFRNTLAQGIGRSRAFGCGLWLIKRV